MRVRVDHDLCESNGVCVRLAPDVFALDDEDRLRVVPGPLPEAVRERVEHAVRRCPKQALTLVEREEGI
jgi:ferredoxin